MNSFCELFFCVFKCFCSAIFFLSHIVVFSGAWFDIFLVIKCFCYEKGFSSVMKRSITMTDLSKLAGLYSSHFEKVNLYNPVVFLDKWAFKRVCKQQQRAGLWQSLFINGQVSLGHSVAVLCRSWHSLARVMKAWQSPAPPAPRPLLPVPNNTFSWKLNLLSSFEKNSE